MSGLHKLVCRSGSPPSEVHWNHIFEWKNNSRLFPSQTTPMNRRSCRSPAPTQKSEPHGLMLHGNPPSCPTPPPQTQPLCLSPDAAVAPSPGCSLPARSGRTPQRSQVGAQRTSGEMLSSPSCGVLGDVPYRLRNTLLPLPLGCKQDPNSLPHPLF